MSNSKRLSLLTAFVIALSMPVSRVAVAQEPSPTPSIELTNVVTSTPTPIVTPAPSATVQPPIEDGETRIFVSDSLLDEEFGLPGQRITNAAALRSLTVLADGEKCVTVPTTGAVNRGSRPAKVTTLPQESNQSLSSTGKLLVIGAEGEPDSCRREGATLTLYNAGGGKLWQQFTVAPGVTYELTSLGIEPLTSGSEENISPPNTGYGAFDSQPQSTTNSWARPAIGAALGALIAASLTFYLTKRRASRR